MCCCGLLLPIFLRLQFDDPSWLVAGTGVNVYVLDTGIRTHHEEFRVPGTNSYRAVSGFDAVSSTGPGTTEDCHGHGSHVAAVIGGKCSCGLTLK